MFEKALMLTGLKKQHMLLGELLESMENKSCPDLSDRAFYCSRSRAVAGNLKRLRKIWRAYGFYLHPARAREDYLRESVRMLSES